MKNKFVIWLSIWLSIICLACSSPSQTGIKTTGAANPQTLPSTSLALKGPVWPSESPILLLDFIALGLKQQALEAPQVAVVPKAKTPKPKPKAQPAGSGSNKTESCIIKNENNGSYGRGTNPTHFGRYQYDYDTWVANGGNPKTWGSASAQEQDQVFRDTVNRHGYSPWKGDGCV